MKQKFNNIPRAFINTGYLQPDQKIDRWIFYRLYEPCFALVATRNPDDNILSNLKLVDREIGIVEISLQDFFETYKVKATNRNRLMKAASKRLSGQQLTVVETDSNGQKSWRWINLFHSIRYDEINKKIVGEIYLPLLLELVSLNSYVRLEREAILAIGQRNTKGSSERLYEILVSASYKKVFTINFDRLREMLGYKSDNRNQYQRWNNFKKKVLDPSIEDINNIPKTNIKYKKENNEITFYIEEIYSTKPQINRNANIDASIINNQLNAWQHHYLMGALRRIKRTDITVETDVYRWCVSHLTTRMDAHSNYRKAINELIKLLSSNKFEKPNELEKEEKPIRDRQLAMWELIKQDKYEELNENFSKEEIISAGYEYALLDDVIVDLDV